MNKELRIMKTKSLLVFVMMLAGLLACSTTKDEPAIVQELETEGETRLTDIDYPYYYFNGEKIGIELSETKSYVLFREVDKDILFNKLSEKGVTFYEQQIRPFRQSSVSKKGNAYDKYIDCLWLEADLNYKELNELPEVIYASPFERPRDSNESWYPMTNKCYVNYYGDWDTLSKIVSDYNVEILGELASFENNYVILCTKESKGHALEVANALYETHLFAASQADFLDGMGD